jgi:hypothetical protein
MFKSIRHEIASRRVTTVFKFNPALGPVGADLCHEAAPMSIVPRRSVVRHDVITDGKPRLACEFTDR